MEERVNSHTKVIFCTQTDTRGDTQSNRWLDTRTDRLIPVYIHSAGV